MWLHNQSLYVLALKIAVDANRPKSASIINYVACHHDSSHELLARVTHQIFRLSKSKWIPNGVNNFIMPYPCTISILEKWHLCHVLRHMSNLLESWGHIPRGPYIRVALQKHPCHCLQNSNHIDQHNWNSSKHNCLASEISGDFVLACDVNNYKDCSGEQWR